jgi:hypothetical protein
LIAGASERNGDAAKIRNFLNLLDSSARRPENRLLPKSVVVFWLTAPTTLTVNKRYLIEKAVELRSSFSDTKTGNLLVGKPFRSFQQRSKIVNTTLPAVVLGVFLLGEGFSPVKMAGIGLVFLGIVVLRS